MKHFFENLYRFLLRKALPKSDKNHLIIPTSKPSIKGTTTIQPIISTEDIDNHNPPKLIRFDAKKALNEH